MVVALLPLGLLVAIGFLLSSYLSAERRNLGLLFESCIGGRQLLAPLVFLRQAKCLRGILILFIPDDVGAALDVLVRLVE